MLKRKTLVPLTIFALVLSGCTLFGKGKPESSQGKGGAPEPVNEIPVKERPYATVIPRADGREVSISVTTLQGASQVEYELEYQAGTLLQGAFGKIDFSKEQAPVVRQILLGSCSAGGKCSYHENVNGGTLLLRYKNGKTTALKGEWNFQIAGKQKGHFNSRDAKFNFDTGDKDLSAQTFVIVAQTMGLPGPIDGEVVGGPYAVFLPSGVSLSKGKQYTMSLRISGDQKATLFAWTEGRWAPLKTGQEGKTLTAQVNTASTVVAISLPSTP